MSFEIITDTSSNIKKDEAKRLGVTVIPLSITVDGREYLSDPDSISFEEFYRCLRKRCKAKTSLINSDTFACAFEAAISRGNDVLCICLSSNVSGTYQSACIAAKMLGEKYPERKIRVVDSLTGTYAEGFLAYHCSQMRSDGKTVEEAEKWALDARYKMNMKLVVDDLFYIRNGGRIPSSIAIAGSIIHAKPIMRVNNEGKMEVCAKAIGKKRALNLLADELIAAEKLQRQTVAIAHNDCENEAQYIAERVRREVPDTDIIIDNLDHVLAIHSGPDALTISYMGEKR